MKFSDLFQTPCAESLDILVEEDRQADIISRMNEPEIALKVMRSGLWYSYMFNRYTIPSFAAHVFQKLTTLPPVNDELGPILAGLVGVIKGELFNNNIFGGIKECHSHYLDMREAYLMAGGSLESVSAIPTLEYSPRGEPYAKFLKETLQNPLATFILIPANEKHTPQFFNAVIKNLSKESRFDKYRQFVERHIELDSGDHSSVTMDWLKYIVEQQPPRIEDANVALTKVLHLIAMSRGK